jgi:hypothetical protein
LIRTDLVNKSKQVWSGITFDIELHARAMRPHRSGDLPHVRGCDVALIGPRMDRDAVNASSDTDVDGIEHPWHLTAT